MSTEQFVDALTKDCRLDPTAIAEVLWLALRQSLPEVSDELGLDLDDEDTAPEGEGDDVPGAQGDEPEPEADEQEGGTDDDSDDEEPTFEIAPALPSGILPKHALPIAVPDAGILNDALPLVRAMKPLLKQIESQLLSSVNEAETVEQIAETDIWSPVLNPEQEPWFDVALVIDSSPSMRIWQRLIQDIQRLLRCYGSFRDFRVWQLTMANGEIGLCTGSGPEPITRSPKLLLMPNARRLILVFSDCTAHYWWDGSLQPIFELWGSSTPTALWQVLPDWMWKRTALGIGEYVAVRNHIPGAKNPKLTPVPLSLRSVVGRNRQRSMTAESSAPLSAPVCVPVVTSEGKSLGAWSRMLAGDRQYSTPGFLLPATGWPLASPSQSGETQDTQTQEDPLATFRLRSTPSARRLAALLSAAPVITLPVMRLIRSSDERLPGSSPLPVAEVFLGGLLKKASEQPETDDPELVQYIFPTEVRDRLLDILPKVEAVDVVEAVSKYVAERLNYTLADFRALLLSPELHQKEADQYGLRSFAKMTAEILSRVGREFDDLVRQLKGIQEPDDDGLKPDTGEADWLEGFTRATLTYQVAEYLNFPTVQSFSFERCELSDSFPPPLKPDQFFIKTLELQSQDPPLEPFQFTIATLIRRGKNWRVERRQSSADCLIEKLPEETSLEMVAIPGGTFLMGSPEDEAERFERESPQHEVTVEPFFMGRYPVTQAQWTVVASMPQVERSLEPAPSNFKGAMLPVEQVSWNDAVEFCARLSVHTGREYRLPSEAEWEYACRAGTTTAFHFGEMITTEVANYDGSAYADGPEGEYRETTTLVDSFGIANAYGLSDMHGNVYEWCQDHWHGNYEGAPVDGSAWLTDNEGARRVRRGGSWVNNPWYCRSAYRLNFVPEDRVSLIGFRVSCAAPRALA